MEPKFWDVQQAVSGNHISLRNGTLIHDLVMNWSSIATGVEGGDDGSVKSVTHGAAVVSVHPGEWYSCIPMYLAE